MVRKVARRQQGNRFFTHCHVAVSHLSHTAFLPRSEWRFRESASLTIGNGKRHPERMWRIYTRGEEYGKVSSATSMKDLPSWREKIQKTHFSNFTAKITSMSRIISILLKKLYSHKWQNKAFLFLCYKLNRRYCKRFHYARSSIIPSLLPFLPDRDIARHESF